MTLIGDGLSIGPMRPTPLDIPIDAHALLARGASRHSALEIRAASPRPRAPSRWVIARVDAGVASELPGVYPEPAVAADVAELLAHLTGESVTGMVMGCGREVR